MCADGKFRADESDIDHWFALIKRFEIVHEMHLMIAPTQLAERLVPFNSHWRRDGRHCWWTRRRCLTNVHYHPVRSSSASRIVQRWWQAGSIAVIQHFLFFRHLLSFSVAQYAKLLSFSRTMLSLFCFSKHAHTHTKPVRFKNRTKQKIKTYNFPWINQGKSHVRMALEILQRRRDTMYGTRKSHTYINWVDYEITFSHVGKKNKQFFKVRVQPRSA